MDASIYRLRLRDLLALCVLALLAFGLIMVQSASSTAVSDPKLQWSPLGWKKTLILRRACRFRRSSSSATSNTEWLARRRNSVLTSPIFWAFVIAAGTCALVLVPHIGSSVNGARRWLKLGPIQIQPSELAKWAAVLFLASWLTRPTARLDRFFADFLPTLIPIGILSLLVVIQDFGTAALIMLCGLTMLLAGRVKIRHLVIMVVPVLAAAAWFIMHKEYRMRRITAFLHPWDNPQGEGYHMIQSLLCFSTGGVSGRRLGNGIQKLGYLPEDTTNFIFAVICEARTYSARCSPSRL